MNFDAVNSVWARTPYHIIPENKIGERVKKLENKQMIYK